MPAQANGRSFDFNQLFQRRVVEDRIFRDNNFAVGIDNVLCTDATQKFFVQKGNGVARVLNQESTNQSKIDRLYVAILFANDDILSNVDEATRQITAVRRAQGGICQALACTVT